MKPRKKRKELGWLSSSSLSFASIACKRLYKTGGPTLPVPGSGHDLHEPNSGEVQTTDRWRDLLEDLRRSEIGFLEALFLVHLIAKKWL